MDGKLREVKERNYTLSFSDSTLNAQVCNSFNTAAWLQKKNRIQFGLTISTMMACEHHEEETGYTQALDQAKYLKTSSSLLQLTDAKGRVLLQAIPLPNKQPEMQPANLDYKALLTSTKWFFKTLFLSEKNETPDGSGAYLQLEGASAFGKSGCNSFKGNAEWMFSTDHAGRLTFGPLMSTRMSCPNHMETEMNILRILEKTDSFLFEKNMLVLLSGEKRLAILRPQ
jgi:heat shock protein HslJ